MFPALLHHKTTDVLRAFIVFIYGSGTGEQCTMPVSFHVLFPEYECVKSCNLAWGISPPSGPSVAFSVLPLSHIVRFVPGADLTSQDPPDYPLVCTAQLYGRIDQSKVQAE